MILSLKGFPVRVNLLRIQFHLVGTSKKMFCVSNVSTAKSSVANKNLCSLCKWSSCSWGSTMFKCEFMKRVLLAWKEQPLSLAMCALGKSCECYSPLWTLWNEWGLSRTPLSCVPLCCSVESLKWWEGQERQRKGNGGTGSTKPGQKQPWNMGAVIGMSAFIFKPSAAVLKWWLCREVKQRNNI